MSTANLASPGRLVQPLWSSSWIDSFAHVMDRAIRIPGTDIRLGLDSLLGLVPVGGDVLSGLIQSSIVLVALQDPRVSGGTVAKMVGNVLLDVSIGAIPVVGDVFDVYYKCSSRNLQLLREARRQADREDNRSETP